MASLRDLWTEDRCAFGGWCSIPSPFSAELMAASGFDYVCVDTQHGLIGYDVMVPMLQAVARTPVAALVRVPSNDWSAIGKALDAGVDGVIVPMVNSAAEAAAAVSACRYAPEGTRSFGPIRAGMLRRGTPLCFVMIETRQAVDAAVQICATPGLDGVYIGPADLAISLGVAPTVVPSDPVHVHAIRAIREACAGAGIVPGIHSANGEVAAAQADEGFRLVTVTGDSALIQVGSRTHLAAARESTEGPAARSSPY